jgi:1,4-alpha-glucan branching enzyme
MVPAGAASFFLQIAMAFPMHILIPLLIALSMTASGCASGLRQGRGTVDGWSCWISAPDARTVSVAGNFNRWDPNSHPLAGPDRSGRWAATLHLPPGHYEYLFVIDGETWVPDPEAPSVDNGLCGRNSIVTVTGGEDGEK